MLEAAHDKKRAYAQAPVCTALDTEGVESFASACSDVSMERSHSAHRSNEEEKSYGRAVRNSHWSTTSCSCHPSVFACIDIDPVWPPDEAVLFVLTRPEAGEHPSAIRVGVVHRQAGWQPMGKFKSEARRLGVGAKRPTETAQGSSRQIAGEWKPRASRLRASAERGKEVIPGSASLFSENCKPVAIDLGAEAERRREMAPGASRIASIGPKGAVERREDGHSTTSNEPGPHSTEVFAVGMCEPSGVRRQQSHLAKGHPMTRELSG